MFSFFRMKGFLKRALPVCLALGLLVLAGCDMGNTGGGNIPGTLPALMRGTWASSGGDKYVIGENTLGYYFEDDEWPFEYTGKIHFVSNYTSNSGVIIFERDGGTYHDPAGNNFTAAYYRNLTDTTVQLADAYDQITSPTETATLDEAVEKFTPGKIGNYVSEWGSYTRGSP